MTRTSRARRRLRWTGEPWRSRDGRPRISQATVAPATAATAAAATADAAIGLLEGCHLMAKAWMRVWWTALSAASRAVARRLRWPPTGSWPAGRTARSRPGSRRRRRGPLPGPPVVDREPEGGRGHHRAGLGAWLAPDGQVEGGGLAAGQAVAGVQPGQGVVQVQQGQRAEVLGRDRRPEPAGAENLSTSRDPGILVDHSPPRRSSRTPVRWPLEQAQGRLPAVAPGRGAVRPVWLCCVAPTRGRLKRRPRSWIRPPGPARRTRPPPAGPLAPRPQARSGLVADSARSHARRSRSWRCGPA
jgi:hypothetical protein